MCVQEPNLGLRMDLQRVAHETDLEALVAEVGAMLVHRDRPVALPEPGEFAEHDVHRGADGFVRFHVICVLIRDGRLKPQSAAVVCGGGDRGRDSEEQSEGGVACGICHGKGIPF